MNGFLKFCYGRVLCGFYSLLFYGTVNSWKIVLIWLLLFLNDFFYYDDNMQGYFLSQQFVNVDKAPVLFLVSVILLVIVPPSWTAHCDEGLTARRKDSSFLGVRIDCFELIRQWLSFKLRDGVGSTSRGATTNEHRVNYFSMFVFYNHWVTHCGRCKHRIASHGEVHGKGS